MSRPVTVSEAQDQVLEIAFDLYRIMQRLHHQNEGMKAGKALAIPLLDHLILGEPPTYVSLVQLGKVL